MSQALDYLLKTRPDAIQPYFAFLKEAGSHLDTRTRDLISVVTKVAVQTERGFRQYMTRALNNGASAHEVLDALLMAFPVLGLSKIVWAIDIILDMDLPAFRPENLDAAPKWRDVMAIADIEVDKPCRQSIGDDRSVFIYRAKEDKIRVYDSRCPHQVTDIPHLAIDGVRLNCPKHGWAFDLRTGDCIEKGNQPLNLLESKIENGRLMVRC